MKQLLFIIISAVIFVTIAAVNTENSQFIDRDTESRQLQGAARYIGCFRDKGNNRALPTKITGKGRLSVAQCNAECHSRSFKYAGRQYLGECYCGNSGYNKNGARTDCNPCDSENVGSWRSCVYDVSNLGGTQSPPSPTPGSNNGRYKYLGCFNDKANRALPLKLNERMSVAQCNAACTREGKKYSARQYKGECFCGNGDYKKHGPSNACKPCDSDDVGGYLSCVYEDKSFGSNPSPNPPPPPSPTPGSNNGRYKYLGCFNDNANRALPLKLNERMSVAQCNAACTRHGKRFSARQYKGECFCGNGDFAKHGPSNACKPCDSDNVGGYLSCVYEDKSFGSNPSPTPPPPPSPIDPGDLKVIDSSTGLKLSEGLKARLIASSNSRVALTNNRYSQEKFFKDPDGAAVFPRPGGGWYYVINSEQFNRNSGVSTLVFNSNGQIEDYQVRIKGTYRNCGGGKTPWGTWVSCEEYARGQCIQIDPSGARSPQVTNIGESSGGNFESFAYDDRNKKNPCFFVTEDHPRGSLRRYCPNVPDGVLKWEILHQSQYSRTYLKLNPTGHNHGTYEWTTSKAAGENSANAYYPNSEGIDRRHQFLYFVSKTKRRLVIVNLDNGTYRWESVNNRLFSGDGGKFEAEPDQVIFSLNEDNLFFTEDGGRTPGIYVRTPSGAYNTLVQAYHGMYVHDETVSLAFSPDGRRMYFGIQEIGRIFEVTRIDGGSFHHLPYGRSLLRGSSSSLPSEGAGNETSGPDLVMGLKFHTLPSF